MRGFRSIEERHGVNQPDYRVPVDEPVIASTEDKRVGPVEIVGSLLIPIAGIVFAIMRFAEDEVGPGFACLLTGIIGFVAWAYALVAILA